MKVGPVGLNHLDRTPIPETKDFSKVSTDYPIVSTLDVNLGEKNFFQPLSV